MMNKEYKKEEALHYLRVLFENSATQQPEIRDAIEFAIKSLNSADKQIARRKVLLDRLWRLGEQRINMNKEIKVVQSELKSLDNLIQYGEDL